MSGQPESARPPPPPPPPPQPRAQSQDIGAAYTKAPRRIAFLHLDSLNCLPALDHLFSALGGRIGLVVTSDRFAGRGGFWRQLTQNLSHSGLRMTLSLGFDIVALRVAAFFAPALRRLGRGNALYTLREHARRVDASYLVANDINATATLDVFGQFKPDLVVSFHFDQILRPAFLEAAVAPVLNVHPAPLPAHRGPCPSFWVLAAGETSSGITIHRIVDASIDSGVTVARHERPVPSGLCVAELDEWLFKDGARALVALLAAGPKGIALDQPVPPQLSLTSPAVSGAYESFPDRRSVRAARRRGVRLWRLSHAARLMMQLFGWRRV